MKNCNHLKAHARFKVQGNVSFGSKLKLSSFLSTQI